MDGLFTGVMRCDGCGGRLAEAPEVDLTSPKYVNYRRAVKEAARYGMWLNAVRRCTQCGELQLSFCSVAFR